MSRMFSISYSFRAIRGRTFFPIWSRWSFSNDPFLTSSLFCYIYWFLYTKKIKGIKKMRFCSRWEIFIFHLILMRFFVIDSIQWGLSVVYQQTLPNDFSWAKQQMLTPVLRIIAGSKLIQSYYCVQPLTMSTTFLCPAK